MSHVDESAGSEQLLRCRAQVMGYIQSLVSSPDDAADLLQDLSLMVLLHEDLPADPAGFLRWCCAAVRNLALHHWRAARRQGEVFEAWDAARSAADLASLPSHEQASVARESIEKCLRMLDTRSRRLLLLRYGAGKTPEEIALMLGQSPAAVRTKLLRARDAFCGHLRNSVSPEPSR